VLVASLEQLARLTSTRRHVPPHPVWQAAPLCWPSHEVINLFNFHCLYVNTHSIRLQKSRCSEHGVVLPMMAATAAAVALGMARLGERQNTGVVCCQHLTMVSAFKASQHWVGGEGH